MNKKRLYITTPIYYPSGNPHIGHAYCSTICDIFARNKRMQGYEVFFLTGTDDHGLKIEKKAKEENKSPKEFVDEVVSKFKVLWDKMEISNDDFIRTTDERHISLVQEVFSTFIKNDDLYLGSYEGWYCIPCESFWTDRQVKENHLCPDCNREVVKEKEECLFFKTNKYIDKVKEFYSKEDSIIPIGRKIEMENNFLNKGLEDLCVSRTSFSWGVPIREYKKHVSYVWVDALFNYLSALNYKKEDDSLYKKFWESEESEVVHVIGADINRFHTIYWPEFLSSMKVRLPDRVLVHGLIVIKGEKMSKSKGNVISPYPLIDRYGIDALRYYYAREIIFGQNGTFTPMQFIDRINNDLVNNYGNLVSRSISMVGKYREFIVPTYKENINKLDNELDLLIENTISNYISLMDEFSITEAMIKIMDLISFANKYIEECAPWVLAKDETKKENLDSVLSHLIRVIFVSTKLLESVLVKKSKEVYEMLGIDSNIDFKEIYNKYLFDNKKVEKKEMLFPRLDPKIEEEFINSLIN